MFMNVGVRRSMHAHAHFARSAERAESRSAATEARGETAAGDSAENAETNRYSHHGSHRHHRGHGPLGGLLRLIALGLIIKLILGGLRKRRGHHRGDMKAEAPDDDLADEIRVGDEINRDEQPAPAVNTDDLTVDDLLHAMKRLGIKKLEL